MLSKHLEVPLTPRSLTCPPVTPAIDHQRRLSVLIIRHTKAHISLRHSLIWWVRSNVAGRWRAVGGGREKQARQTETRPSRHVVLLHSAPLLIKLLESEAATGHTDFSSPHLHVHWRGGVQAAADETDHRLLLTFPPRILTCYIHFRC